jgi:hypothetical protein
MDYKLKAKKTSLIKITLTVKEAKKLREGFKAMGGPVYGSIVDQFDDVLVEAIDEVEYS